MQFRMPEPASRLFPKGRVARSCTVGACSSGLAQAKIPPYTPPAFLVYRRLVLVVVRRSDATIEADYRGNDRAQNDQEQLNDLPSRGASTPMR